MLLAGDEFGRTQHGNNNAYCQDNEISWLDWKQAATPEAQTLADYVARLARLRRDNPVLLSRQFLHGKDEVAPGVLDIAWFDTHGEAISSDSWNNPEKRLLAVRRAARNGDGTVTILTMLLNPGESERTFTLPKPHLPCRLLIDSAAPAKGEQNIAGADVPVAARSVMLLKAVWRPAAS
jgi:glycogen operon protein